MVKHLLLGCAMAAGCAGITLAQNQSYYSDFMGETNGVSDNGRFVAIGDIENNIAYLWSSENPDVFTDITPSPAETAELPSGQRIKGALAYDVSDNGIVVGSLLYADGHSACAYYDGEKWTALPLHPAAMNTNEAVAITPDGKIIMGYQFISDKTSAIKGRYYPVQYILNDKGTYDFKAYTDIELPDHQGFFPIAQTADGKAIGGRLFCGIQSSIPALVIDGQLKIFNELTTKSEPWIYAGKYYCGDDETTGRQIWTTDPEDPRIVLFPEHYIDGYRDGDEGLDGGFAGCDAEGNFYGNRTLISNVDENGNGTLRTGACIYNYITDTWTQDNKYQYFTIGVGNNLLFGSNNTVIVDGEEQDIAEYYGIDTGARSLAGINKCSANGKVLGGLSYEIHPASGEYVYYPFVTVCEGAFSTSVGNVFGGADRPSFLVSGNCITLRNGESMTVYDTNGRKVAEGKTASVAPGLYVVKSGEVSAKIIVR